MYCLKRGGSQDFWSTLLVMRDDANENKNNPWI